MDSLSLTLYTEIDIACILLLLYVVVKSYGHVERRESWHFFQLAIYFIIFFVASDLLWEWMEHGLIPRPRVISYVVNSAYFLFCIAGIAAWFFYTECELEADLVRRRSFFVIAAIPLSLTLAVLALNHYNHCLFYLDENGIYRRGSLNILGFLIPCLYLGFCVIHALTKAFQKENYVKRKNYLNLAGFALPTTIPCVLQIFIAGTPLPCIGLSASVLLVYMTSQELLVSIDPLTKLNNRNHMVRYLNHKIEHYERKNYLFLLLLDLDQFKQVNDNWGHVEGDHALIRFASVLKQVSSIFNCFISRYGGDEFLIVYETEDKKNLGALCDAIHKTLEESNRRAKKEYLLSTSIGCAEYDETIRYVPEFIALADRALYEVKMRRG